MVSGKVSRFKTTYSFSATIVIEVLAAEKSVDSALISRILPFIEKCFKKGSSEEYEVLFLLVLCYDSVEYFVNGHSFTF